MIRLTIAKKYAKALLEVGLRMGITKPSGKI